MNKTLSALLLTSTLMATAAAQQPVLIPYVDGKKWGYADTNGKVVIEPKWRWIGFFNNGRAEVYTENEHCIIDTKGDYIIPPYRHWDGKFYNSGIGAYYNAKGKNGKYCIIDSNNREIVACVYDKTDPGNVFTEGGYFSWNKSMNKYVAKMSKNGKFGVIDSSQRAIIPFEWDGIDISGSYPFSSPKFFVVKKNNKYGVIDTQGRVMIEPKWRNVWLDKENDNQVMLFRERTTVIADTNGNITWEIPGYTLGFPRHSLIPVEDSAHRHGLMNYDRKVVIPDSNYIGIWMERDTIVVSKQFPDSANNKVQMFRYHDIQTYRALSGWLTYDQYRPQPVVAAAAPATPAPVLNDKLPHFAQMYVHGKLVYEYKIGNILWSLCGQAKMQEYFMHVRGIADKDTIARYAAVIDSNGKYIVAPQLTDNEIRVINAKDRLVAIRVKNKAPYDLGLIKNDSFVVADFNMKTILPIQQYAIADAFYHKRQFYVITKHDHAHWERWHSFEGGGSYEAHDYTYFLVTAGGKPATGMEQYKLHWYTDDSGYRVQNNTNDRARDDGFNAPFKGYFMAEDNTGNRGIVSINGEVLLPALSFKYNRINRIGPEVFLVDNVLSEREQRHRRTIYLDGHIEPERNPLRGLPYLVNAQNQVLLDSVSVKEARETSMPGYPLLYTVFTKPYDMKYFYMSRKGLGYYGKLPEKDKTE